MMIGLMADIETRLDIASFKQVGSKVFNDSILDSLEIENSLQSESKV